MLFCRGVFPYLNGPKFKAPDLRLHPLPSAAVSAAFPVGHAALAFVDVGVGFTNRAAAVAVGFRGIYGFYKRTKEHRTTEEEMEVRVPNSS
jgi:hypothetical protein